MIDSLSRIALNSKYLMNPYEVPREANITSGTLDSCQTHAVAIILVVVQLLSNVETFSVLEEDDVVGHLVALP